MRVEPGLAPVDVLHRAEPPGAEQRRDPGGPGPLAHAVEALAVLDLVAVGELLVGQDVAVRVHDPLREPGRARRVVELGWIVRRRVLADEVGRRRRQGLLVDHERVRRPRPVEARRVLGVGDEQRAPASPRAGARSRRRRRAPTSRAGSRRASRRRRRSPPSPASAAGRPRRGRRGSPPARRACAPPGSPGPAAHPSRARGPSRRSSPTPSRACRADACRRRRRRCCSAPARPSGGRHTSRRSSGCSSDEIIACPGRCEAQPRQSFSLGR